MKYCIWVIDLYTQNEFSRENLFKNVYLLINYIKLVLK